MQSDTVIEIKNLKKKYKLGSIGGGTLRGEIQSRLALLRGKEDPNAVIGAQGGYGKEFWALRGVDLTIRRGERLGIIGHNGAGKSTLLKLLSHITAPTEGEIRLKGRITSMLEVGTGFHGELTGRENIYLNAAILGMTRSEVDKKIEDIIRFSECEEFIDTPVKRYSSGMYVKLAFSVAAHLDSEIMIMDEVLAVGDVNFQDRCLGKMREVADQEERTIIYVSHNMNTIRKLCDRCVVLNRGEKVYDGEPDGAIDVYVGKDMIQDSIFDLGERRAGEQGRFISFQFLDANKGSYEQKEIIKIRVGVRAYENLKGMHIRFILKYLDTSNVGTYFTQTFDLTKGCDSEWDVELPLLVIPEGQFYIRTVLAQGTEYGSWRDYAAIEQVATFAVLKNKASYLGMNWREGWRVNLGTVEIEKRREEKTDEKLGYSGRTI